MLTLLIETSTERGVVAFARDDVLIYQVELPFGLQNSKHLIPAIHAGLESVGLRLKDFSLVAAGVGPGSYTGIRVGAAAAKAIAYGAAIPIVGVSSLVGFVPYEDGTFAGVIDAKQGGVYVVRGEKHCGTVVCTMPPIVSSLQDAELLCNEVRWIVSPNCEPLRLRGMSDPSLNGAAWVERYPDSSLMISWALERANQGSIPSSSNLELLYLKEWQNAYIR